MNNKIVPILLIILECIGTYMCLSDGLGSLIYYTVLSNILNLISCICFVLFSEKQWTKELRYVSTCCLILTFLVVLFVLIPMRHDMGLLYRESNLYTHLLCPILSFISFCFIEQPEELNVNYAIAPTFLYAAIMIVCNILYLVDGPYEFLKVHHQSIFTSCFWTVFILGISVGIALGVKKIIQLKQRHSYNMKRSLN